MYLPLIPIVLRLPRHLGIEVLNRMDQWLQLWRSIFALVTERDNVHANGGKDPECLQRHIEKAAHVVSWILDHELVSQV